MVKKLSDSKYWAFEVAESFRKQNLNFRTGLSRDKPTKTLSFIAEIEFRGKLFSYIPLSGILS